MEKVKQICDYGCGNTAFFRKIGRGRIIKWSCCENLQHCPAMRARHAEKSSKSVQERIDSGAFAIQLAKAKVTMDRIQPDGTTIREYNINKMVETRNKNNSFSTGARKAADTKLNTIDEKTGKTLAKLGGEKGGLTRTTTILENGLTIAQDSSHRAIITRSIVDEFGLNSFDRSELESKRLKKHELCGILYASSYEKKFIEILITENGLEWVKQKLKRGPTIKYPDPENQFITRLYFSDFIYENTLIEVKSNWIFFKNSRVKLLNIAKLDESVKLGYDTWLCYNNVLLKWSEVREEFLITPAFYD
jgi:hypothetical protein